jgi:hypothetical protein
MRSETEALAALKNNLTERIDDVVQFGRSVRGKALRKDFRAFAAKMQPGDELWGWHWEMETGRMYNYAYGWCIVRDGVPVDSYLIHTS